MQESEARRLIYQGLDSLLRDSGFVLKKSDEGFFRRFPGGWHAIYVPLWSYPPRHVFSIHTAVRIDQIEKIFCETHDYIKGSDRTKTYSMQAQIWKLAGMEKPLRDNPLPDSGSPFYYTVASPEDIAKTMDAIKPVLLEYVLPFFQEHQDVVSINRALNHAGLDTSNTWLAHGIIAARLANDANYAEFLKRYQAEMEKWPATNRKYFDRAVEYLRSLPD